MEEDPLRITELRTDALIPYARNSRTHSKEQIQQIADSITEFGFVNPVLIDEKCSIIAGHGRVLAALLLERRTVPTIILTGLTEAQRRAYVIADNKIALNAGWDEVMLGEELKLLQLETVPLEIIGFADEEAEGYIAKAERSDGLVDEEETPEEQPDAVTVEGELWSMGKHRLLCGDATDASDVAMLLDGVEPHLMVTDPPYGVEYDPEWRNRNFGEGNRSTSYMDKNDDTNQSWDKAWDLFHGDVAYIWCGYKQEKVLTSVFINIGFEYRAQIIWSKSNFAVSRGHYSFQHETCGYFVRKGGRSNWSGRNNASTIWKIEQAKKTDDAKTSHATQKPVECMRRPIENNSNPGQAVYEPFMGSGTTLIAAETTGRTAFGIELMTTHCDMAVRRWQNFTGKEAVNQDGKTFAQCEAVRIGSEDDDDLKPF